MLLPVLLPVLGWLYANVLGNLVASLLWAGPAFLHLHIRLNRIHGAAKTGRESNPLTEAR